MTDSKICAVHRQRQEDVHGGAHGALATDAVVDGSGFDHLFISPNSCV